MAKEFKVDFLCAGFEKCATTTLDAVLRQHSDIALPLIKELHFREWNKKCDNPMEVIKHKFFPNVCDNMTVGIIDHTFSECPNLVYRYMGKDIKIIFMLRNPAERLFSFYKMALWLGYPVVYESTLNGKEITKVKDSFDRYVIGELAKEKKGRDLLRGNYIDVISKFNRYYDRSLMKFIFFEDYISNQEKSVSEILDFLSLPYQKITFDVWENKGDLISKDNLSFKINRKMSVRFDRARCNPRATASQFDRAVMLFKKVNNITTVTNNDKMSDEARRLLEQYYNESVRRLEDFLNTDLSSIWF